MKRDMEQKFGEMGIIHEVKLSKSSQCATVNVVRLSGKGNLDTLICQQTYLVFDECFFVALRYHH